MENSDKSIIYGFCRLRLTDYAGICRDYKKNKLGGTKIVSSKNVVAFPELLNCALIRELHVYGSMNPVYNSENKNIQHRGIGKRLLKKAEEIAIQNNFRKIAVISGVGVRNYYRKFGYNLINTFMIKELNQDISYYDMIKINIYLLKLITIILFCIIYFYIKYYY
jgi:histone acetyltransferase (RNA polymerase elongator complex component)